MWRTLGEQEHAIWRLVERLGRCSVREVYEAQDSRRAVAYNTIATVLDRLLTKGIVSRERDGRSFIYRVSRSAAAIERAQARSLIARVLGPDPEPAIARLVDAVEAIDPDLLDRLVTEIATRRRDRRGS